ncbi:sorbosone dehydrogenase family protein [Rhodocytophaga aerolata]|uniref:Sorbosone dehydrogenase family protein n=1 Tax=Rhodocytophaga aerolata TaxID=455078 RepID=A0ABT8RK98_9BACT|nr:sorbosone dehydrogenase family protein [Rhodocytophaga aerolata]MDO1451783.1 sorbosone dehydrogenase family protein [Rhodocytophaga aerolata]
MKNVTSWITGCMLLVWAGACQNNKNDQQADTKEEKQAIADTSRTYTETTAAAQQVNLPKPFATESAKKFANVIGWPQGKTPQAPDGFKVTKFAEGLDNPRWMYQAPNGDIFVAESATMPNAVEKVEAVVSGKSKSQNLGSANRITLLRDANGDGKPEVQQPFLTDLNQPLGMVVLNNSFYVANTDGIMQYPYKEGATKIAASGKKILSLPADGYNNHWTRNIIASKDGSKMYISVGSASNVGEYGMENEVRRAAILEVNPDGTGERIYASGLRNPVGIAWAPGTNTLWAAVNERDELGDELVPDYLTSVQEDGFYGWPYAYFGQHEDPRRKGERPDLVKKTIVPDVALASHSASLGLAFYDKNAFPEKYRNGAFVGQHGSWNRSAFSGYKVVFVPFQNGKPTDKPEDFLTGFIANGEEVHGRPVGITVLADGSMLVADDAANTIWRVSAQ